MYLQSQTSMYYPSVEQHGSRTTLIYTPCIMLNKFFLVNLDVTIQNTLILIRCLVWTELHMEVNIEIGRLWSFAG